MATTFKVTLKAEKRGDNTHAIRVRLIKDRVIRYYNTGITVKKTDWNPKATEEKFNWIRTSNYEHAHLNESLLLMVRDMRAISLKYLAYSADEIIARYKAGDQADAGPCFLAFFRRENERIAQVGHPRTLARRLAAYNKLKGFAGENLYMPSLDVAFMRDYITHLQVKHNNRSETIKKEVQFLSGLAKLAVQEGLLPLHQNPFPYLSVKSKPRKKDRLSEEQLETFRTCALPSHRPRLEDVRNTFMLQFYLHGARIGDALELRWENVRKDRIEYVMRKNGKLKSIRRTEQINELLAKYKGVTTYFVLPFLGAEFEQAYNTDLAPKVLRHNQAELLEDIKRKTAFINYTLKTIAKIAKIELSISTHVARHTFSDIARKKIRDIHTLKNMLAHESVKTTEVYLSAFDQEDMDEASDAIYGN